MRQRIEDLGRIAVMIDNLLEQPVFQEEKMQPGRFPHWFIQQTKDKQEDVLMRVAYGLDVVEDALINMKEIALGQDPLNDPKDV